MKHIAVRTDSESKALYFENSPTPLPDQNEVLVRVEAFGVNRADLLQKDGHYPPPKGASKILGLECSGIVEACGSGVKEWKPGDKVMGLVDGGAYSEYCKIDAGLVWEKPENMSFAQAAAIPEVYLTAFQSLYWLSNIKESKKILIHAAASGVGLAALQIAMLEKDLTIFGTVSTGKVEFCQNAGYDKVIDYKREDFFKVIEDIINGKGVDVILDFIGANYFTRNIKSLSIDGTLVILAVLGGVKVKEANLLPILSKRLKIQGSTLRSRSLQYKRKLVTSFRNELEEHFNTGKLTPTIYEEIHWTEIERAHSIMSENRNIGKIVMTTN